MQPETGVAAYGEKVTIAVGIAGIGRQRIGGDIACGHYSGCSVGIGAYRSRSVHPEEQLRGFFGGIGGPLDAPIGIDLYEFHILGGAVELEIVVIDIFHQPEVETGIGSVQGSFGQAAIGLLLQVITTAVVGLQVVEPGDIRAYG